jgi:carboxymethylenebutenolidase
MFEDKVMIMGTMVTLGGSTSAGTGYLSEPAVPGPGVLVVHDFYGALPHIRELCDALAAAGFTALGPDLYGGRVAIDPADAEHLLAALDAARSRGMLTAAARQLRAHPSVRPERIGAVGFSMGGWLALSVATSGVLDAVVGYYAALGPDERAHIPCPVLLHFAELDRWDPPETPDSFVAELEAAGGLVDTRTWPGARHGFANADTRGYSPEPATAAWADTVEFLGRHLRGPTARSDRRS